MHQLISRSIKEVREENGYGHRMGMDAYLRILRVLGVTGNNDASII